MGGRTFFPYKPPSTKHSLFEGVVPTIFCDLPVGRSGFFLAYFFLGGGALHHSRMNEFVKHLGIWKHFSVRVKRTIFSDQGEC